MRTPHALFAATAALVAAAVVPPSHAAAAVPAAGTYYVQSATTGLNAADNGGAVEQHNPKGNEDHQQWNLRGSGPSYVLESADTQGSCLGRSGDQARTVSCTSADAAWDIAPGEMALGPECPQGVLVIALTLRRPGPDGLKGCWQRRQVWTPGDVRYTALRHRGEHVRR